MDWTKFEQALDPKGVGRKVRLVKLRKVGKMWIRDVWFKNKEAPAKDSADTFLSELEEYACRRVVEIGDDL
jgi:hypothetical protein